MECIRVPHESSLMLSRLLSSLTGHRRRSFAKRTSPCHWFHTPFPIQFDRRSIHTEDCRGEALYSEWNICFK